jgi:RNA polymerase sigma factor (sigma-70 family)
MLGFGPGVRQDFLDFFDAEYLLVVRFMMRVGATLPDAQDAAQHMAEQGWRTTLAGRWNQISNPRGWARTVALNHHRASIRRRLLDAPSGLRCEVAFPDHGELVGQAQDLVALLRTLDTDSRAVIAFDLDDTPAEQIALALGKTAQEIRDLRKKARKKLKEQLLLASTPPEGRNIQ